MTNARMYALPLVGVLALAAWFLFFRPTLDEGAPAPGAAPPPKASEVASPRAPSKDGTRALDPKPAAELATDAPPPATVRDAKRSDAIRRALRDRARDDSHERAGTARDDDGGDQGEAPTGTLDKDYIRDRIREDLVPIAKECYESALEDDPKLAGKIIMTFGIAGDEEVGGVVDEAAVDPTSTLQHPALGECMRESMMSLSFPAPEGGGRVEVTYPFDFSPDPPAPK